MARDNERTPGTRNEEIDLEKVAELSEHKPTLKSVDEEIDLEKAIELTGFGRYHAGLITICGLCLMSMVHETMGTSFILPAAQCDLELTTTDKGYLSGVTFLGMVMGAHAWGFCADTFGRKKVLLCSVFGAWTFSFLSSFSPTAGIFIAFRFLTGLSLCGTTSTVYAYLSEFLPSSTRAKIMTWTCGFVAAAYLMIPGVAWILIPEEFRWDFGFVVFTSWRLFIIIMGSLSLLEFFVFLYFPESPKFLMSVGKKQEAIEVLRRIYSTNTGNVPDDYPVKDLKFEATGSGQDSHARISVTPRGLAKIIWRQTAPLFQQPYGWTTFLFCLLQVGIYAGSGGMYLWIPNLLNMMTVVDSVDPNGSAASGAATICEFVSHRVNITSYSSTESSSTVECSNVIRDEVYMSTLVVGAFYVATYTTYGGLVSLFGKRNVLVSALTLGGFAGVGSYFARDEITVTLLLSGYVVLSGTCASVLSAAIVDVYPTHLRAMAVSLTLTCGRLGSGVAGSVIGILIEYNCDMTIIGVGCITLSCGLLCIFLPR